ncbi:lamin tail domain-containing protein [Candidatus Woesearchaeota archaeon]|nr:lamin tail domain-containing protein [Candidatus Woesearchaeota archaeon]
MGAWFQKRLWLQVLFAVFLLSLPLNAYSAVLINEFLPNSVNTDYEWVELFNNGSLSVNLSGFNISEEGANKNFTIGDTPIEAKGFLVLVRNETVFNQIYTLAITGGTVSDTLLEKQTKTYTLSGKNYEVTLDFVDSDEAQFIVDNKATKKLKVGESDKLSNGTIIGITGILYQDYAGGIHSATFFIGKTPVVEYGPSVRLLNLNDGDDSLFLYNASGILVDSILKYTNPGENVSVGRYPDGNSRIFNLSTLTPGAKNDKESPNLNKWLNPSANNTKASAVVNVTLNITDDTTQVNSTIINFNGTNFSMNKNGDIWSFLWNTSLNAQKKYNITIFFNDSYGKASSDALFNITVNNSPFIISFSPSNLTQTLAENSILSFNVNTSDPDDALLNFSWLVDNALNSTKPVNFSYTPSFDDNGTHTINATIKDPASNQISIKWTVVVANVNRAPILNQILNQTASKNTNLTFNITAIDLDNDTLTFSANKSGIAISKDNNNSLATVSWKPKNTDLGSNAINFTVSDGFAADSKLIVIAVNATGNLAPSINSSPGNIARKGEAYAYDVDAADLDNDTLGFSLKTNATGMSINSSTGLIKFVPSSTGFFAVNVSVSDLAAIANQSYNLTVAGSRLNITSFLPPSLNQVMREGSALNFSINISDQDKMLAGISWLVDSILNSVNSTNFSYSPRFGDSGTHSVNATIKDVLSEETSVKWTVTVTKVNMAPILGPITDKTVSKNNNLRFNITGSDPDNDTLIFSSNHSSIAITSVNRSIAAVSWRPTNLDLGAHTVNFTASDGFLTDSKVITIIVDSAGNRAPQITSSAATNGIRDELYNYDIDATDADNDTLSFSLNSNATGMSINSATGLISFTPLSAGVFSVNASATDFVGTANQSYVLTVTVGRRLRIENVVAKVDGKKSSNVRENSKISKEAKPGSDVEFKITVKNNFLESDGIKISDIKVETAIEGIDDGDDLEEESNDFDLDEQHDKAVTLKFRLPLNIDEGDFDVAIHAEGEDDDGNVYERDFNTELEVEKEKHDLRFLSLDLSPAVVSCNRIVAVRNNIINVGDEDEENAALEIKSQGLGLSLIQKGIAINEGVEDNAYSKSSNIKLSDNVENGDYQLTANIYSDDGKLMDSRTAGIKVADCIKTKAPRDEVVLLLGTEAKGSNAQNNIAPVKTALQKTVVESSPDSGRNLQLLLASSFVLTMGFLAAVIVLYFII